MSRASIFLTIIASLTAGAVTYAAGRGGRGGPPPHAANPAQDTRFGTAYFNTSPAPLPPVTQYPDKAAWEKRAEFLRHQVAVANGLWPMPMRTPLNPTVHGTIDKADFTIEKVYFASMPGHYVTGNLYVPKNIPQGKKVPAILAPYGHWGTAPNNGRFWWRTDAEIQREMASGGEKSEVAARSPLQTTCMNLAHMGCVVFEWDLVGYCDSTVIKHQEGFTDSEAVLRLQSFMGLQTWNGTRAMDFVLSLLYVDPARVASVGSSGGATQTMQLGATEPRLAATFPIVMVDLHNQGGCVCENAPLLRVGTNNVEIATLSAPRPQGDCGGSTDQSGDFETNGYPFMKHIYEVLGAADQSQAFTVQAGHNHNLQSRELLYNFINRTFKLGIKEPITETPIEPVPVVQLSVWDATHKMPADFADAKTLRAAMTKASDEQIAALQKDPPAYRDMLKVALQAMVSDTLPSAADVTTTVDPLFAGVATWRGILARKDSGERIPFAYVKPQNWNGTAILWADPRGIKALLADSGIPTPEAAKILAGGTMILAIDPFMSDTFKRPTPQPAAAGIRMNYSAFFNGYERTILGNRVHDLLSAIAFARGVKGLKSLDVLASGDAAPQAVLATALAEDQITRAAIDLAGFDFDKVTSDNDPNFLPGALKYGGIYPFATLCAGPGKKNLLAGARETGGFALAAKTENLTLEKSARTAAELAVWLLQ